jgi:hypothetical protein
MGMFKQYKQMRGMVQQMPAVIDQAQALQRQAQAAAQAAQGAYGTQGAYGMAGYGAVPQPAAPVDGDPRLSPIEGVTLADYARLSKIAATRGLDLNGLLALVTAQGFDPAVYQRATGAWNDRFKGDIGLATLYGRLYQEAQA